MSAYSQRASSRPIEGPNKEFAMAIRDILGWNQASEHVFISTRAAARKTGLSNGTIASMAHGDPTSRESIIKFAAGLGGNSALLMQLAGFVPSQLSTIFDNDGKPVGVTFDRNSPFRPDTRIAGESISAFFSFSRFHVDFDIINGVELATLFMHEALGLPPNEMADAMEREMKGEQGALISVLQKWGAVQSFFVQRYNDGDETALAFDARIGELYRKLCKYFDTQSRPTREVSDADDTHASQNVIVECYQDAGQLNNGLMAWYFQTNNEPGRDRFMSEC